MNRTARDRRSFAPLYSGVETVPRLEVVRSSAAVISNGRHAVRVIYSIPAFTITLLYTDNVKETEFLRHIQVCQRLVSTYQIVCSGSDWDYLRTSSCHF